MDIYLRQAVEADIPFLLDILNYEILYSTAVYDTTEKTIEEQLSWFRKKQEDKFPVIVAEMESKVVAYGTYGEFRPWKAFHPTVEHSLYVAKEARGNKVGKLLMGEIIQLAKNNGYHSMIAGIDATNNGSYEFHEKFGFQEVGRLKKVGFKFNRWLDLVFMQLVIEDCM